MDSESNVVRGITRRSFLAGTLFVIATGASAVTGLTGCAPGETAQRKAMQDGVYASEARGHNGSLTVQVAVKDQAIVSVDVPEHVESLGIGTVAIGQVPAQIVDHQTLLVDAVSGATLTSMAITTGVQDCIKQAGGNVRDFQAEIAYEVPAPQTLSCDVLVVGAGVGGLSAALAAVDAGANVVLLEKQGFAGGNSLLSTGILQAAGSSLQKAQGIDDSPEQYYAEMMEVTEGKRDPVLVNIVTQTSGETIDWLIEKGSVFFDEVKQGVGSKAYRAHTASPDASGLDIGLADACETMCTVFYNTAATEFLFNANGAIVGAKAAGKHGEQYTVNASKVVLSCGGFGASDEMVARYAGEDALSMVYAGSAGATGEMLQATLDAGAASVDIEKLFNSPTTETESGMLITAMVLSGGGIMCDHGGKRFTNETGSPNDYFEDIQATGDFVYEIFNDDVVGKVPKISAVYMNQGIVHEVSGLAGLAEATGMPREALEATFASLDAVSQGAEDEFGREYLNTVYDPEGTLYYLTVNTGYLSTNGGLRINERAEVLKPDGSIMGNLYAVGDAVGGYRPYGYVCGDANMFAATTGRVAGSDAGASA